MNVNEPGMIQLIPLEFLYFEGNTGILNGMLKCLGGEVYFLLVVPPVLSKQTTWLNVGTSCKIVGKAESILTFIKQH
jgi:hypothetical protein